MLLFRAVIEVLGKPQEHVKSSLSGYLENIKESEAFTLQTSHVSEVKKQNDAELWNMFAEVEVETKNLEDLSRFCLDFMPSMVEVLEPASYTYSSQELSLFFNDLQAKLHAVDMVAKQRAFEIATLQQSMTGLLQNYVTVLLKSEKKLTSKDLAYLTGVSLDRLEDFLDLLIDKGKIDLKEGVYFLTNHE